MEPPQVRRLEAAAEAAPRLGGSDSAPDHWPGARPRPLQPRHRRAELRGCDLVALQVGDVAPHGYAIDRATVRQSKTGRPVRFELTDLTRMALDAYLRESGRRPQQHLWVGRGDRDGHRSTRQYAHLVDERVALIGLEPLLYGTHSLRRTRATLIYRKTGNLRAVHLLLGHTKTKSTVCYLGVEVDDALEISEHVDI